MPLQEEVSELYRRLIDGCNANDAPAMAAPVAGDGLVIGYDGSQMFGRDEVASQLGQIFADHKTATYVAKVRSVKRLGSDAALLHAVVGWSCPARPSSCPTATPSRPWSRIAATTAGVSRCSRPPQPSSTAGRS